MEPQENPYGYSHKVTFAPKMFDVIWAHNDPWFPLDSHPHWSRRFEYPWVTANGDFKEGMEVLDAAGGKGELAIRVADLGCNVTCVDLDETGRISHLKVKYETGNIHKLNQKNNTFDRVLCVSVLEHTNDPIGILSELNRVLKPGGKLLVTLDVASNRRYNHSIDIEEANNILNYIYGPHPHSTLLPPPPKRGLLINVFPEIDPQPWEHREVILRVLCLYKVKQ